MSNCSFLLNPQQLSPRSLTSSRTTRPTSCCAASSRAGGSAGGQSRATVPLLTDLALVFLVSTGEKSRCKPLFKKKKKKRATSSSIWSVWTECFIYPHEHAVRRACPRHNVNFCSWFSFFFFLSLHIFFVNSHCIISFFLCLSANPSVDLNRSHMMVIGKKKKKRVKVWSGYLWNPAGFFIVIVSCTWPQEGKKTTQRSSCHVKKKKPGCKKSVSPRGCFCHRTFQLDTRWCGMSFAITALLVILARCHSS